MSGRRHRHRQNFLHLAGLKLCPRQTRAPRPAPAPAATAGAWHGACPSVTGYRARPDALTAVWVAAGARWPSFPRLSSIPRCARTAPPFPVTADGRLGRCRPSFSAAPVRCPHIGSSPRFQLSARAMAFSLARVGPHFAAGETEAQLRLRGASWRQRPRVGGPGSTGRTDSTRCGVFSGCASALSSRGH